MEWMSAIRESIRYMEDNIMTVSGPGEIASFVNMSETYLQQGFQVATGLTLGEYIRNRRLYLAAMDLIGTDDMITEIAYRYGYETPESFTKAFKRFHSANPTQIRKNERAPKTFLPLRVTMTVTGGEVPEVAVEKLDGFRLIGKVEDMPFEEHLVKIPRYLDDFEKKYTDILKGTRSPGVGKYENAVYKNRIGEYDAFTVKGAEKGWVRFMIAGMYMGGDVPSETEVWDIPASVWAKFSCDGPLHNTATNIKKYIWYEWLPCNSEYELCGDYFITKYSRNLAASDMDYHSELWMPVKKTT